MKRAVIVFVLSNIGFIVLGQEAQRFNYDDLSRVSTQYFKTISSRDAKKMLTFYEDEIKYMDPTYGFGSGKPLILNSKEEIYALYNTQFTKTMQRIDFVEKKRFFSGNVGVFTGEVQIDYKQSGTGESDPRIIHWKTDYVITLFFKDQKIIKQIDFINYPEAIVQQTK